MKPKKPGNTAIESVEVDLKCSFGDVTVPLVFVKSNQCDQQEARVSIINK